MTVGVAPTARPSRSPSPAGGSSAAAAPLLPMATRPPPSGGGGGGRRGRLPTALLAALSFGGLCLFLAVAPQAPRLGPPVGEPAGAAGGGGPAVSSVPPPPPVARAAAAASASDASAAVGANAEEHPQVPPSAEALKALWMTPEEAASMLEVMRKDMVYLEYGSGGSTMAFAPLAARAYSVEHNEEWCERMRHLLAAKGLTHRVTYACTPVARGTGGWGVGHEFEEGTYRVFQPYVDAVTAFNESVFDIVLLDGRARVACALKVLPYLNDDSLLLLHDARRDKYVRSAIGRYYEPLGEVVGAKGVRIFRRKRGIEALLPLADAVIHAAYEEGGGGGASGGGDGGGGATATT